MVEIVISVAAKVAEYMVYPVCRQLSYLFRHRHHVDDLNRRIEDLEDVRERLGDSVQQARTRGDEIYSNVQKWLEDAEGIIRKKEGFAEDENQASRSCFYLKSRYRLSKRAKKQALAIDAKLERASKFGDRVSKAPRPPSITAASSQICEAFPSRQSIFDRIMESLRNEETSRVGVWGMGGVGKTTLALQIAKRSEEERLFPMVVMASSISQTPNISEIQNEIAKTLRFKFEEGENRADRLKNSLKAKEKIMVILDDIWGELDLETIGIPCGDDHKGCKLLLTSRDKWVLVSNMGAQQLFHLQHLNEEEAWMLFKKTAGDSVESPEIRPFADEIVKQCEGLPVAIVTIAKALKEKSPPVWRNALEELKNAAPTNLRGVSKMVYSCLELSYNHLESDEAKSLFLLCGLLEDAHISMDRLLLYCMSLNLFKGLHSWEKATDRVITLVNGLKDSSLLLEPDEDRAQGRYGRMFFKDALVKIHDVVGDVARSIASKDASQYVVREAAELTAGLSYSRISLECGDMNALPQRLVCPELELFLLNSRFNGGEDMRIPDDFFQGLTKLRIVHLSGVSLGSSLGSLSNLRALCLNECQLQDMAVVGELKSLQALSLAGSNIEKLPKEMKQLRELRVLDLRDCCGLRIIPRDLISSLSQLEYLSLERCRRIEWAREGVKSSGDRNINASLSEIKHLPHLKTLELHVLDANLLPDDEMLFHKNVNLSRYSILIGQRWPLDLYGANYSRRLLAEDVEIPEVLLNCFSQLFKSIRELGVSGLNGIKDVVYELDRDHGFVELKNLNIWECPNIEYILDSRRDHQWVPPCNTLSKLKQLRLGDLDKLEAVCHGPIPVGCFRNLRLLRLWSCDRLKHVFESSTMELAFPHLQTLAMEDLPELISFFCLTTTTTEGSQDRIPIFNRQVSFPALESVFVDALINAQALWEKQLAAATNSFFKVVKKLSIFRCHKLQSVFPLSVAKALVQLEELSICDCNGVETIVAAEEEDESLVVSPLPILFPKVTSLELKGLSQLKRFCSSTRSTLSWPALENLDVWERNQVEVVFQGLIGPNEGDQQLIDITTIQQPLFLVDQVSFPALESLTVRELINTQALWEKPLETADSFTKVKVLSIFRCPKLQNVFPLCVAKALVQLEELCIQYCDGVETIVADEEEDESATKPPVILFPKVTYLFLKLLPQLKTFCFCTRFTLRWSALKSLEIHECNHVEALFQGLIGPNEGDQPLIDITTIQQVPFLVDKDAFPALESIYISSLNSMRALWYNPEISADFFPKLKTLTVNYCDKLLKVFPLSVAKAFGQLKELCIESCEGVEEIVTSHKDDTTTSLSLFPNLTSLKLTNLPQLKKFYSKKFASRWPCLKSLELKGCDKVEILFAQETVVESGGFAAIEIQQPFFFLQKDAFPALESISISRLKSMRALYKSQISADFFPALKKLTVNSCDKLLNVFPLSVAKAFSQLKELYIESCEGVEEIVTSHEDDTTSLSLFSNLTFLRLYNLPQLKRFCSKASRWPCLKSLELKGCDKVEILFAQEIVVESGGFAAIEIQQPFFFLQKEAFSNLETLTIIKLEGVVEIWQGQFSGVSFSNLRKLTIEQCHCISAVVPRNVVQALQNLKSLKVKDCASLNIVIQVVDGESPTYDEIDFPVLKKIELEDLPNLKNFCSVTSAFRFPSLKLVAVEKCPKMEIFWKGDLKTTMLEYEEMGGLLRQYQRGIIDVDQLIRQADL